MKSKKYFYKKWWFWLIVVIVIFRIIGGTKNSGKDNKTTQTELSKAETVNVQKDTVTETVNVKVSGDTSSEIAVKESKLEEKSKPELDTKEKLKKAVEDKERLVWFGNVRNDVTGNWRLSEYASGDSQESFAADYYKAFFGDNKEIHFVINMTRGATGCLQVLNGANSNILDVTIKKYVKGEEHDAKKLFDGALLGEYWVHLDTGVIEKIK